MEIAARLGMTVAELDARMSAREFLDWAHYITGSQSVEDMIGVIEKWRQSVTSS